CRSVFLRQQNLQQYQIRYFLFYSLFHFFAICHSFCLITAAAQSIYQKLPDISFVFHTVNHFFTSATVLPCSARESALYSVFTLKAPDSVCLIICGIFYFFDLYIITCIVIYLHIDPVSLMMSQDSLSQRRFYTDLVIQGISSDGGHQFIPFCLIIIFKINFHKVVHTCLSCFGGVRNNRGGFQHSLQITDPALVFILIPLGCIILKVLTKIPLGSGFFYSLDGLFPYHPFPVVNLLLDLFHIALGQSLSHNKLPFCQYSICQSRYYHLFLQYNPF